MWIALLLCIVPQAEAVHDRVDLVEINHYHDCHAKHVFTQIIFRSYDQRTNHFAIVDWRLSKQASQHPIGRTAVWFDGNTLRKVTAKHVIETWTQDGGDGDVELIERNERPTDQRRGLSKPTSRRTAKELLGDL